MHFEPFSWTPSIGPRVVELRLSSFQKDGLSVIGPISEAEVARQTDRRGAAGLSPVLRLQSGRRVDPVTGSFLAGTYAAPESEVPFVPTG